jgi:hypothetical protein
MNITLEIIRNTFGWCAIINMGILLFWVFIISFAGNWVYRVHCKFFELTREQFNGINYAGIAFFKIAIFMLNIVPYLALRIVAQG